jgi:pimeloyl-ACP methyl ester carboxylesterase
MLQFKQFGAEHGRLAFYFHGAPGAPEEGAIFHQCAKQNGITLICPDRFSIDPALDGEAYFNHLAMQILAIAGARNFDLIGFSIGTFVALKISRHLGERVENVHLVSSAAPLEAGAFLNDMAGKPVFALARAFPAGLFLLSYWQALIAFLFPRALFRLLFASAVADDQTLASDAAFQSSLAGILRACFVGNVRGYVRDLRLYVQPWASTLPEIKAKVHLWHGTMDNWSPPAMADYLQTSIPRCTSRVTFEGKSHYSCLYQSVEPICQQLKNEKGMNN